MHACVCHTFWHINTCSNALSEMNDKEKKDIIYFYYYKRDAIPSRKIKQTGVPEVGVSEEGVCCKVVFL